MVSPQIAAPIARKQASPPAGEAPRTERPPLLLHLAGYLFAAVAVYRGAGLITTTRNAYIILAALAAGCVLSFLLARHAVWLRAIANVCVVAVFAGCLVYYFKRKPPVIEVIEWSVVGLIVSQAMGACRPKHYTVLATLALMLTLIAIRRSGTLPQRVLLPVLVFGLIFAATQVAALPDKVSPLPGRRRIVPWHAWSIRISLLIIVALVGGPLLSRGLPIIVLGGKSESTDLWVNYIRFSLGLDERVPHQSDTRNEMPNNDKDFLQRYYASRALMDLSKTDPSRLTNKLLFTVRTESPSLLRGAALDFYDGRGWKPSMHLMFRPISNSKVLNFIIPLPDKSLNSEISGLTSRIWAQTYIGRIVYHPAGANSLKRGDLGVVLADQLDNIYSSIPIGRGRGYECIIATFNPTSLTQAPIGGDVPAIKEQYLQLPLLPDRLIRRCNTAVIGERSRLKAVMKLTALVQEGKSYDDGPKNIPAGRDAVDYFLFEMDSAACSHFASALAVCCRIAGIPARVETGFGPGTYSQNSMTYEVREKDSHAWTQVWFPRAGWVDFDPTPGRFSSVPKAEKRESVEEAIKKFRTRAASLRARANALSKRVGAWAKRHSRWPLYGLAGAVALWVLLRVLRALLRRLFWRLRWARTKRLAPRQAAAEVYRCCIEWVRRVGVAVPPTMTPTEIADEADRAQYPWAPDFAEITRMAEQIIFSGETPSHQSAIDLRRRVRALKSRLRLRPHTPDAPA